MAADDTAGSGFGWRWLIILALAVLGLIALERSFSILSRPAPVLPFAGTSNGVAQSYEDALAQLDRRIVDAEATSRDRPRDWRTHETLARRYLLRARLTGSYDDFATADAALALAFQFAPRNDGPHLAKAELDLALNRIGEAEKALNSVRHYAVAPTAAEQADIAAMRGDIAFARGQYGAAVQAYDEADRHVAGTTNLRRAIFNSRIGRPDLAARSFDQAAAGPSRRTPQEVAELELQRGLAALDAGQRNEALARFQRANAIFPGDWRTERRIAEVNALNGDLGSAERLYARIASRTGHPAAFDALSELARRRGDPAAMLDWTAKASEAWEKRLNRFPEASYGDALGHCFAVENWACALTLAERDHANRPFGETKVRLARALLANNRAPEARTLIEQVLASPWRTAEVHAVAADIYAALGNAAAAEAQRRQALQLNPDIFPVQPPAAEEANPAAT